MPDSFNADGNFDLDDQSLGFNSDDSGKVSSLSDALSTLSGGNDDGDDADDAADGGASVAFGDAQLYEGAIGDTAESLTSLGTNTQEAET